MRNRVRRAKRLLLEPRANNRSIFPEIGCIFVHIPKTAGTSIRIYFRQLCADATPGADAPILLEAARKNRRPHRKASEIKASLGADVWGRCFTFTFVRNPWDLLVSSYFWWQQTAYRNNPLLKSSIRVRRMADFSEFLHSDLGSSCINEHPGEMSDWFMEDVRQIVSFVGRFENLEEDTRYIVSQLNLGHSTIPELPHLNKTQRRDYRQYFNDADRLLVADRFAPVIERFGYEF